MSVRPARRMRQLRRVRPAALRAGPKSSRPEDRRLVGQRERQLADVVIEDGLRPDSYGIHRFDSVIDIFCALRQESVGKILRFPEAFTM